MEIAADPRLRRSRDVRRLMPTLSDLLLEIGLEPISAELEERFSSYMRLLIRWNSKLNLTSIRSEGEIQRRHFLECIFCAQHLPVGVTNLLDYGSGAGFPGIPIALCRSATTVTLAESSGKKAAFLREAVRELRLDSEVFAGRAQDLPQHFSAVTLRAVERMKEAIPVAVTRLAPGGLLVLMVSRSSRFEELYPQVNWGEAIPLPGSERTVLLTGRVKVPRGTS